MLLKRVLIIIRGFIITLTLTSVQFAWSVFEISMILIFTIEHIHVKNLTFVLFVIKDLQKKLFYKNTKQLIVMIENLHVWCALTKEFLKQKVIWLNTWSTIMNLNIAVHSVVRNFILQVSWTNTWSSILNLHIHAENVIKKIHFKSFEKTRKNSFALVLYYFLLSDCLPLFMFL